MTDTREICNLSDQELKARRAELSGGLGSKVRDRRNLYDGVALFFDATPEIREALNAFVAFEGECCPTLSLSISEASGLLQLEIRGIEPASSLFEDIGAGIGLAANSASGSSRRWRRILSSAGLGTLGAVIVCCVLPFAMVSVLGIAAVAPFTNLDNPWSISASALLFAGGIWVWRRRRDDAQAAASIGGCGC